MSRPTPESGLVSVGDQVEFDYKGASIVGTLVYLGRQHSATRRVDVNRLVYWTSGVERNRFVALRKSGARDKFIKYRSPSSKGFIVRVGDCYYSPEVVYLST